MCELHDLLYTEWNLSVDALLLITCPLILEYFYNEKKHSGFNSYWWSSFGNGRIYVLKGSYSVIAYFLNVVLVYYADLCFCHKGS